MIDYNDLLKFKTRIDAVTRALTGRIGELVKEGRKRQLTLPEKDELRFHVRVLNPPMDLLIRDWDRIINKTMGKPE